MTGTRTGDALQVAVTAGVPERTLTGLARRLPAARFVRVPTLGAWPAASETCTILFTAGLSRDELTAVVRRLPDLAWVHTASSGVDRVLVSEVIERGIRVTRTAQARATPMAEHVVTVTLALVRDIPAVLERQRARRWQRSAAGTLAGATVLIVGAGAVGRAAAGPFRALGARVMGIRNDPAPLAEFDAVSGPDRLDVSLGVADVVVLACPLTPATRRLMGRERFDAMRPSAYLVNVARGEVVVESELIDALADRRIAGAALDVFEDEPLPAVSPLWSMQNVIVTPHCAGASPGVWDAVEQEFAGNLERWSTGRSLDNEVGADPSAY